MTLEEILKEERRIWDPQRLDASQIAICMGVVYGDICRLIRDSETGIYDDDQWMKEFGNMLASTIRWADDLGYNAEECIELAFEAQRHFPK